MSLETIVDPSTSGASRPPALDAGLVMDEGTHFVLPQGLLGFPEITAYHLEDVRGTFGRFVRLCADATPGLSFLLMREPVSTSLLDQADLAEGCRTARIEPEEAAILFVVTLRRAETLEIFLNRRAPLFIDAQRGIGAQVVLPRNDYALRHPVTRN